MRSLLCILAAVSLLTGCGLKGPLYIEADKPAPKQPVKPLPTTPATGSGQPS